MLVYLAAAFAAASVVVARPTQSAMLPSLSQSPEELTAANGAAGVVEGTGVLLGPLLAALVLTVAGPALVFGLAAIGVAIAALLVLGVKPGTHGIEIEEEREARTGATVPARS